MSCAYAIILMLKLYMYIKSQIPILSKTTFNKVNI